LRNFWKNLIGPRLGEKCWNRNGGSGTKDIASERITISEKRLEGYAMNYTQNIVHERKGGELFLKAEHVG